MIKNAHTVGAHLYGRPVETDNYPSLQSANNHKNHQNHTKITVQTNKKKTASRGSLYFTLSPLLEGIPAKAGMTCRFYFATITRLVTLLLLASYTLKK